MSGMPGNLYFLPFAFIAPFIGRTSFLANPHLLSLHYLSPSWGANRHRVKPLNDRFGFCFSAGNIIASKLELFYGNKTYNFFKWNFVSATVEVPFGPCWVDTDAECLFHENSDDWYHIKKLKGKDNFFKKHNFRSVKAKSLAPQFANYF